MNIVAEAKFLEWIKFDYRAYFMLLWINCELTKITKNHTKVWIV